jgi:hypothetical protein
LLLSLTIFFTFPFYIAQVATLREDASGVSKQPTSVVEVSESNIDQVMSMLNEADPTLPESDPSGKSASYNCYMYNHIIENEYTQI